MPRKIDINIHEHLNPWIKKSLDLFNNNNYLDQILEIYPFQIAVPTRLNKELSREIMMAHAARDTPKLFSLLKNLTKFPYDDPIWYLLKSVKGCFDNNPRQVQRIADSLYSMTAEEVVVRLESAPKINTQMGPMFTKWLKNRYKSLHADEFMNSDTGIVNLHASEEEAKRFVNDVLKQDLPKRPDLFVKVNSTYIIGEAKWIGQPGGNQEKQVGEVVQFCSKQRGSVIRIGIVDGFPWAIHNLSGRLINNKEAVNIQESPYNIISALLLDEYLGGFL
ncbi:hypothetical protein HQ865_15775 [Mucilaginibacter mali]|uniref:Tsp45I type II restriction enzyme n=1 Tax=Mucilaginibacter mali TaxID=2740462 RepID=A0A7D4QGK2_9SPHI|nr:hypothetical protein [Mucilaginibacter mali]QKJ31152.1 hypothetical protein HQ865_15775 [Mucilaginibacter mali]